MGVSPLGTTNIIGWISPKTKKIKFQNFRGSGTQYPVFRFNSKITFLDIFWLNLVTQLYFGIWNMHFSDNFSFTTHFKMEIFVYLQSWSRYHVFLREKTTKTFLNDPNATRQSGCSFGSSSASALKLSFSLALSALDCINAT